MNIVQTLIGENKLKDAIDILLKVSHDRNSIITLNARLSSIEKEKLGGVISGEEARLETAKIRQAILHEAGRVKNWGDTGKVETQVVEGNKVSTVKKIFQSIKEDLENLNYSKPVIIGYTNSLNAAFESKIFTAFTNSLTRGDWDDMNSVEQKEACKKVLETLSYNEEKVVSRMIDFQSRLNGTVSLDESIQLFFDRPTIKSWNELSEQLTNRFSNSSLFGEMVSHAFDGWKNKLNDLDDELSFALDFNFEYRSDFGAFLNTNLSPKNFNY
tara:strand:+ start:10464 stop:11276 length:813 start_codon:yes stop_codon:yes gene_type:complete